MKIVRRVVYPLALLCAAASIAWLLTQHPKEWHVPAPWVAETRKIVERDIYGSDGKGSAGYKTWFRTDNGITGTIDGVYHGTRVTVYCRPGHPRVCGSWHAVRKMTREWGRFIFAGLVLIVSLAAILAEWLEHYIHLTQEIR